MAIRADRRELMRHLSAIVGERSPYRGGHLARVEDYFERELKSFGVAVESDFFNYWGRSFRNVVGHLKGPARGGWFILGAHLDTVEGTPGADDNASGVAVLLEAARLLSRQRPSVPVLFCGFNLEEWNMIGSSHYVRRLRAAKVSVAGMLSLEMVGYTDPRPGSQRYPPGLGWFYPDRGDFIGLVGNWRSKPLLRHVARAMRSVYGLPVETISLPGNGFLLPDSRLSDHSPFWDAGMPALLVTDTSFYRNPHYHRPTDTIETLNVEFMAKVCEGVVAAALGMR